MVEKGIDPQASRNTEIAEEFEEGAYLEHSGEDRHDSFHTVETEALPSVDGAAIDGTAVEESRFPRDTETYREFYETEFFMDAFGFDFEADSFEIPGSLNVYLEEGIMKVEYQVDKQRSHGKMFEYSNQQIDEAIGFGKVNDEHFSFEFERGRRPYLRVEAEYSEGSKPAREETMGRISDMVDILE